jgi:ATP-dependent helicase/nuclease subunit A
MSNLSMERCVSSTTFELLKTNEIVRAGAGAGKTYALTHRVMDVADRYFQEHGRFPRVIVTTFTRKATQELRERLMLLAIEEKPHLIDFVNSRSQLVVSTIHGVMDLYLKRYGANICVDPGYTVVSSYQSGRLARQVLREVLFGEGKSELLESFQFNLLTTMVRRLDGLDFEAPNARPYSEKDFMGIFDQIANDLAQRLLSCAQSIKAEATKEDWLEMADYFLEIAKILKRGKWSENRSVLLTALEGLKTARRNAKNPPVADETADEAEEVRNALKDLAEPVYDPRAWSEFANKYKDLQTVAQKFALEFRKRKREQGILEISDLEHLAMQCIREHPRSSEAFATEWDYWLVDEFQDTSPFQVKLLKALVGDRAQFIVGDPQQSIYLFRGARSEVFSDREKEIAIGGGQQSYLTMNRRSHPELLLFLNDFFAHFDPPFQPMEPFLKEGEVLDPSRVVCRIAIAGASDDGDTEDHELKGIVSHVLDLLSRGVRHEEICVLARTNKALMGIAVYLNRFSLPTHVHAASGFYGRRETRDALALLKFLVNPQDGENLVELLRSPWFRLSDQDLSRFALEKPKSLWHRMSSELELEAIGRLNELLMSSKHESLSGAFRKALIDSGFIDLSHFHDVSGRREANIWKLVISLENEERKAGFNPLAFIATSEQSAVQIEESNAEGDAVAAVEPDRINLMTVHASKGLEFKHVILPGMQRKPKLTTQEEFTFDEEQGLWATRLPFGEDGERVASLAETVWVKKFQKQELQEHARVLYVALTRAVESVYLSWTNPAQKTSWAENLQDRGWLDLKPGLHQREGYAYEVLGEGAKTVHRDSSTLKKEVQVRESWNEVASRKSQKSSQDKSVSVSRILGPGPITSAKPKAQVSNATENVPHRLKIAAEGTAVHKLMELLKYDPSKSELMKLVSKWFPNDIARITKGIEFVTRLKSPNLSEIIKDGEVEWGFHIRHNGLAIEGQVDLWGRSRDGQVWIIDYKSGTSRKKAEAFKQLSLYALALRKSGLIREDEKIKLAAVYPLAEETYFEAEPSLEAIERIIAEYSKSESAKGD